MIGKHLAKDSAMKTVGRRTMLEPKLAQDKQGRSGQLKLVSGSRVAVIGAGPAGSFFSYFLLDLAQRVGIDLQVDIYEPRDFSRPGPAGCNMCGGIISESLVQALAAEGINLPSDVVQRGIDSYVLHMDVGSVHIETPLHEKRIAAVHRGGGPRDIKQKDWKSFDCYLLGLAAEKGAKLISERVEEVIRQEDRPQVKTRSGQSPPYDLIVVAAGINSAILKRLEEAGFGYEAPKATKTAIREYYLGRQAINRKLGSSMHVFLLKIPRLQFAAVIPKGDYVTTCLLGKEIDEELVRSFMDAPEVKQCMQTDWQSDQRSCLCGPRMNIGPATKLFMDRMVFIGDSGVSRLYKDGIGAAYRTAKAAATAALLHGISARDFKRHYWPVCRDIKSDNLIGKIIFAMTNLIQTFRFARRAMLRMTAKEQQEPGSRRRMSMILWDMFTGSSPYGEIVLRGMHPFFLMRLLGNVIISLVSRRRRVQLKKYPTETAVLGRPYENGQAIVRQGEAGDCMYVVHSGQVEVVQQDHDKEVRLAVLGEGDFFGEMALFERTARSATVRALGKANVLTVDRTTLLRRIEEDPSLAFRLLERLCHRLRHMDAKLVGRRSEE